MKRIFALIFAAMLTLGITACGNNAQDTPVDAVNQAGEDAGIEADENAKELESLGRDAIQALLEESFQDTARFVSTDISAKPETLSLRDEEGLASYALDLDVSLVYRDLIAGENPAEPLQEGEEHTLAFPMRVHAEATEDGIQIDSTTLVALTEENGQTEERPMEWYLPKYGDAGNRFANGKVIGWSGEGEDARLSFERMLWVEETGGYTDNGYFVLNMQHQYEMPLDENCEVQINDGDGLPVPLSTMAQTVDENHPLWERLCEIALENGKVRYILERYIP